MNQQLIDACRRGDLIQTNELFPKLLKNQKECKRLMIESGIDANKVEHISSQILNLNDLLKDACKGGNRDIVQLIIQNGANQWFDAFNNACEKSHLHIMRLLFDTFNSQQPLSKDNLQQSLQFACASGNMNCVCFVLNQGAKETEYSFYQSISSGNIEMIDHFFHYINVEEIEWDCIFDRICDSSCKSVEVAEYFITNTKVEVDLNFFLEIAAQKGKRDIVELLIQHGANKLHEGFFGALIGEQPELALFFLKKDYKNIIENHGRDYRMTNVFLYEDVLRFCLSVEVNSCNDDDNDSVFDLWPFQDLFGNTQLHFFKKIEWNHVLEIAFECGRKNIGIYSYPQLVHFLNRNVNLHQLSNYGLIFVADAQRKRNTIQRLFNYVMSFVHHANIVTLVKHLISSQLSFE